MQTLDSSIREQADAFHQHMNHSQDLFRKAVVALAVDQAMLQLERVPEPPRRCLVRTVAVGLLRGSWRLGRRLFWLSFGRRRGFAETWHGEVSGNDPIIIGLSTEQLDHRSWLFHPRPPFLTNPLRQSLAGAHPSHWLPPGNPSEERSSDHE